MNFHEFRFHPTLISRNILFLLRLLFKVGENKVANFAESVSRPRREEEFRPVDCFIFTVVTRQSARREERQVPKF